MIEKETELILLEERLALTGKEMSSHLTGYEDIMARFSGGGSVALYDVADFLSSSGSTLSDNERKEITLAIGCYAADCIARGQLKDLAGLHRIFGQVGVIQLSIDPEYKEKVQFYHENLDKMQIERLLLSFYGGELTDAVYGFPVRTSQGDSHSESQRRMNHAVAYLQEVLPNSHITEHTVREIRQYGELLQLMNGRNAALDEISEDLSHALTILCEDLCSSTLPYLRNAIPYNARRRLEENNG